MAISGSFSLTSPWGPGRREEESADTVHLEEIDVHPAHSRRGLGTLLLLHMCRWAALHGYEWVTLTTLPDLAVERACPLRAFGVRRRAPAGPVACAAMRGRRPGPART